jgi:PAS domain S-box-containing protein
VDLESRREEKPRAPLDPRDAEIARLKREVAVLRERESASRSEAQNARKHFADLTPMSKRFAYSMRATVGERQPQSRRLAAQYAVSQVLVEAYDLDDAAPKIYEILGERLGWQAGALWKVDEDSSPPVLRRAGHWRSGGSPSGALEEASGSMVFRPGEGLPGRVWERGEPVWVEDILADGRMPRKEPADADGLRGALAFPIVDGRFVGVFELFRREVLPPDEDLMRTAGLVGGQISQFLERRRAEEERDLALVREREARERATDILESVDDAFFALDEERRFTYVNRRAEGLWGKTRGELLGRNIWGMFPEAAGSESYRAVEKVLREGEPAEYEAFSPVLGVWVYGRVYPSPGGVSVLFHSIEERKKAEETRRRSEERAVFRATLADTLRPLGDPVEIQAEAARALGLHLGAGRVYYGEISGDGEYVVANRDYADGVPHLTGKFRMEDFGPPLIDALRAGRTLVMADVAGSPELSEAEKRTYAGVSVGAQVGVPLVKEGRLVAVLSVHQPEARAWTEDEIALVKETAERTWTAVERARAEEALRESEERYRSLFQSIDEGFCTVEMLFDEDGRPFDYRFRENNPAFEKQTGLEGATGKTARELVPNLEEWWFEIYGEVALTGEPARFENRAEGMNRWFDVYAYRVGGPESRTVGILFSDITQRKLAAETLRESEQRLQRALAIETVGVIFFKSEGEIFEANEAFLQMSGYDREDLAAGQVRWDTMTPPEHMARSLEAIEEFEATGRTTPYEKQYVRKDGSRWWGLFAARRLNEGEGVEYIVDITEAKRAEEALRESEERFRAIADLVPDLLWSNDPSGSTSWYNRRWFEYTGRKVGESEAYGWLYAVHPDDREASLQAFLAAVDGGGPLRLEHRIRGVDGRYRWFLVQARPLLDDDGRVVRWFGAATDVHEQRTALEALGDSEKRYRSLAEATSSIVWTGDENGAVVEEMPGWEAFTGQTYPEYRGFGWLHALHPEDRPPENLWEKLSASDPTPMEGEYRLRSREGEYRRIVLRGVPILGERGETREWVGTIFDVEDTRRAEEEREELRREAERERTRLETILQQVPGGMFIADTSGRLVLANEGGERVYGRKIGSIEECVENSLSYPDGEELPPDDWPLIRALKGEAVSGMEYYVVRPDGTRCIVRANSAPVRDERGNVVAAVKAFEDVTKRKEVERERDRSRERERDAREAAKEAERRLAFYAGAREERQVISRELHDRVAHSIAVVRQNLELYEVLRDRNPEAASKKMELAKQEAKASLKSTRDLSMMLRRSEVEEGLARALEGLKQTTIPPGVGYESTVTGDESLVPPHIGNQIFLILREAVRNAVNHSGCGSVAVQLQITKERVIGTVEDDGQGFEPEGAHAGGGLRSMKERASLVGGAFRLRSVSEGGAKIEVTVPLPGDDS